MCNDIAQVWCEVTALPSIEYSYYVALGSLRTELIIVVFAYVVRSKRIQSNVYISTLCGSCARLDRAPSLATAS